MAEKSKHQLSFDLTSREQKSRPVINVNNYNVVSFVDASTRSFRNEAVARVSKAGIFAANGTKNK